MKYTHKFDPYINISFIIPVTFIIFEQFCTLLYQVDDISFSSTFRKVLICPVYVTEHSNSSLYTPVLTSLS